MTFICHFPSCDEVQNSDFCFILQLVPVSNRTKNIPERKGSLANYDLVFQVSLPALGYSTYFIKMSTSKPFVVHLFYIEPIFYIESLFYIEYFCNFLFLLVIEKVIFQAKHHQDIMSMKSISPYMPLGLHRGIHFFLISTRKHRLWVLVRTASLRQF